MCCWRRPKASNHQCLLEQMSQICTCTCEQYSLYLLVEGTRVDELKKILKRENTRKCMFVHTYTHACIWYEQDHEREIRELVRVWNKERPHQGRTKNAGVQCEAGDGQELTSVQQLANFYNRYDATDYCVRIASYYMHVAKKQEWLLLRCKGLAFWATINVLECSVVTRTNGCGGINVINVCVCVCVQ